MSLEIEEEYITAGRGAVCYSVTVLRRALLFAIPARIAALLLGAFLPLGKAVVADPRMLIAWRTGLNSVLGLVPAVTLLLFLVILYRELTGRANPSRRQVWAFVAGCGMVIQIVVGIAWPLLAVNWLPPQIRAQVDLPAQWMQASRTILPAVIWIAFLLVFWRDAAPLGRRATRALALVLCTFTISPVVNGFRGVVAGVQRYRSEWHERTAALPGAQGQMQRGQAGVTLAVHLIATCGSSGAGAPMQLSGTTESYCLKQPAIVDQRDITWAEFDPYSTDKPRIGLTFNDDAARRLGEVTGKKIGALAGVVLNGQLLLVATIQSRLDQLSVAGLAHDVAERVVETFQRRHPIFTFWNLVILRAWEFVIVRAVLLAAAAALAFFLFSVMWTGPEPESAPGAAAL